MTKQYYDCTFFNANVITLDKLNPVADMVMIREGKFTYVGEYKENSINNSVLSIDLKGKTILPGFIDLHTHLWAEAPTISVDLGSAKTFAEALEILKAEVKSKSPSEWIFASNWDESKWLDRQDFLDRKILDEISIKNPIYAKREDGHLVSINSPALKILQIPGSHPGLEKDSNGIPSGILKDVWLDMSEFYKEIIPANILDSIDIATSKGITSVVDNLTIIPKGQKNIIQAYQKLDNEGKLNIRVFLNPTIALLQEFHHLGLQQNWGSDKLRFYGFKAFVDGALGAKTARIIFPYVGTDIKGNIFINQEEIINNITFAEENNYTMCIHAIGDEAIDILLDCYEKGISATGRKRSERKHRIEHAEMITNEQVLKAKKLGILLSMQPNFLKWEYPGGLYETRLGKDRFMGLNRFAEIQRLGAQLYFGSDNMPLSPLYGINIATNFPSEAIQISVLDALRAYTVNNSEALFMENKIGTITVGKFADFVILTQSPLDIPKSDISDELVESTYVNGKLVFQKDK
ncbi:MAG: amidohydrolase [Candidatus Heimdallarchaeota archaeon]|nr:amidohydrolase [Candidatus Heimdallarchaeota archaeon]